MNRRLALLWAVVLKDLRQFWPLAALTIAIILAQTLYNGDFAPARNYLPLLALLVSGLFVISLVHQDAPASLRHEWLTRPIGSPDLLLAKALLAAMVVLLPAALGPAIAAARDGASVPEALLSAIAVMSGYLFIGFFLLLVSAITSTLLEAAGVLLGFFLLFVLVLPILLRISGLPEAVLMLGSGWVVIYILALVMFAGGMVVLWLQYASRRTLVARGVFAGTVAAFAVTMMLLTWDAVFAVQRFATNRAPVPADFTLAAAPGCFEVEPVDPAALAASDEPVTDETQADARSGAVTFWTAVRGEGLPQGWRMAPGYVQGAFVDGHGARLHQLEPLHFTPDWRVGPGGELEARNSWLMRREQFNSLVGHTRVLRFDYQVMLLAPLRNADIPADGIRRDLAGIGSCAATVRFGAAIQVTCFKAGRQPDLLTARPTGQAADQEVPSDRPNYAPGLLQLSAGKHHAMILKRANVSAASRVTITAYEARAGVTRSVTAPACWKPAAPHG